VADIANAILQIIPSENQVPMVKTSDRPGQVLRHTADFSKIKATLGWAPAVSFEDGLSRTVAWYKANRNWWEGKLNMRHVPIEIEKGRSELQ